MRLVIASDHGGFELKKEIAQFLRDRKIEVTDLGSEGTESVDYPDYAARVAEQVSAGKADAGLLICGTGIGMCITANKFKGVRAAVVSDPFTAKMSKQHNNVNVLCLGGRVQKPDEAKALVKIWLGTPFEGGRHERRLQKIGELEKKNLK